MGFIPNTNIAYVRDGAGGVEKVPSVAILLQELLGMREAAACLGISERRLRDIAEKREVCFFLIDGKKHFAKSDLTNYVAMKHFRAMGA